MKTKIEEFEVLIPNLDGTGIADRVKVPVTLEWDEEVKQWLLTPEAHEKIDYTKARLIGLLLPAQLKELRKRCNYTHKQMGEIFQVGEKSWTRWESGNHRPSRSMNLLIRALYDGEISIDYLLKRAGKPPMVNTETIAKTDEADISTWLSAKTGAYQLSPDLNYPGKAGEKLLSVFISYKSCTKVQSVQSEILKSFLKHLLSESSQKGQNANPFANMHSHVFSRQAPGHRYIQPALKQQRINLLPTEG